MSKPESDFQVNRQFLRFKNKKVLITLKNREEDEGRVIALDNYLNIVLETDNGIKFVKGTTISFISLKE